MQTQNQHLLQQLTDRDDYNIKVCLVVIYIGVHFVTMSLFPITSVAYFSDSLTTVGLAIRNCFMRSFMQLVSESVKTKQAQSVLLSEKQALTKQLQQINASVEFLKMKISYSEEQVIFPGSLESLSLLSCITLNFNHADGDLSDRSHQIYPRRKTFCSQPRNGQVGIGRG